MKTEEARHKCPICGEHEFSKYNSHSKCPHCGWYDEAIDEEFPDSPGINCYGLHLTQALYKEYGTIHPTEEEYDQFLPRWLEERNKRNGT